MSGLRTRSAECETTDVVDGWSGIVGRDENTPERRSEIDALIDGAVAAINRGDRLVATALAGQVLAADHDNTDAEDLLAAPGDVGEIRRLTLLFADLVDSTALSTRVELETYRSVVGRYREQVRQTVTRHEGHIGRVAGDGMLAVFGHPVAHEDDVLRAVRAAVEIVARVAEISAQARRRFGIDIDVRVGVHRGLTYLDTGEEDVYGLAANLTARVSGLAPPGAVVVSAPVEALIRKHFELESCAAAPVKGVKGLITHYRVIEQLATRSDPSYGMLVGRMPERAAIRRCWDAVREYGSTVALAFRGEPGIGKSRLAADAADLVERCGGRVVHLYGSSNHCDVGLHPVRRLLEQHCGIDRHTPPDQRLRLLEVELSTLGLDSAKMVPVLAPVLAIGPEHGYEPVRAQGKKLEELIASTIQAYLSARCGAGPALLVAEDLHWFDSSSVDLLGSILKADQSALLIVFTGRDGGWPPPGWPLAVHDLAPITDAEADELMLSIDATLSPSERSEVRRRCDGVPFHIEQVVAGIRMATDDGRRVPDSLYEPLLARLRSADNAVPVVEAAAVIGRRFDRLLLTAVVDLRIESVDAVMDELGNARVFEPLENDEWQFRHELLRELAEELAPPSVRQALHAKVADRLIQDTTGDPDWPLVAAHYGHAGRPAEAAAAYCRASHTARHRGALAESRAYLTNALAQLELSPPSRDRDRQEIGPRLERGFLTAIAEGAQSAVAVSDFERCLQLAGTDLSEDQVFATLLAVGAYYVWRGDLHRAGQIAAAVTEGATLGRQWFRPVMAASSGIIAWLGGEFDTARQLFVQATELRSDDYERRAQALWFVTHDPVALAHEHLAYSRLLAGHLATAEEQLAQATQRAGRLGYPQGPYNLLYAIDMEIWVRTEARQFDRARDLIGRMAAECEKNGLDDLFWQLLCATEQHMVDGLALVTAGRGDATALPGLIEGLTQIVGIWQDVGAVTFRPFYWCILGQLLVGSGALDQARTRIDGALGFAEESGVHFYDAELLRVRAATRLEPDVRTADLAAARDLARAQGAWLFELRAAIDDVDDRGAGAASVLADVVGRAPADCALVELIRARRILA